MRQQKRLAFSTFGPAGRGGQLAITDGSGNDRDKARNDSTGQDNSNRGFPHTHQTPSTPLEPDDPTKFDPYGALGLKRRETPTADDIKAAYHKMAPRHHPDKDAKKTPTEIEHSKVRMKEINRAHDLLSDPDRKKAYDEERIVQDWQFNEWMSKRKAAGSYRR
jgi:hypothetical protein